LADRPLACRYRALLFDLDGVLYLRDRVIEAAPAAVAELRRLGPALGFITNNSAFSPATVAAKLRRLGIEAAEPEVVTSAQATLHLLGGPAKLRGTRVLVVGGEGLRQTLAGAGATVLGEGDDWRQADTVVVGYDPDLIYDKLAAAALAIGAGARFVGSNPDVSLPSPEGPVPGAGATLALLSATTGRQPEVAGKPARALFETAAERVGPGPYLMVGDRADTDLDGATRLGWDSALVLTGVTTLARLLDQVTEPPTWLLRDVAGVLGPAQPAIGPPPGGPGGAPPADELAAAARLLAVPAVAPERTLLASAGGQVVGAISWDLSGGGASLLGPVVTAGERGRLTGTRLLLAAAGLRAAGVRSLRATPGEAEGFFTRLGFAPERGGSALVRDLAAG
jgi:glycerol 3-phosphatase-2